MIYGQQTMMQPLPIFLLCIIFVVQVLSLDTNESFQHVDEVKNMRMIREYLMKINKPAEKTIKSPDGDIIDCVLFHKQPAFDHPLLKDKIPKELPKRSNRLDSTKTLQLWNKNGDECPEGTIPIRRTTEEDILRATSLQRFVMKPILNRKASQTAYEVAMGVVGPGAYSGAAADLNIWKPHVDGRIELSSSLVWMHSNPTDDINTIAAGWQVYPNYYKDNSTRFFVYWTTDSHSRTGCFDLLCPGFVQTSSKISLGAAILNVSSYDGDQASIGVFIDKDEFTENWFLIYNKDEVGYWPKELLPAIAESASFVQFGGEIINSANGGSHTSTEMGSGHFPKEGFGRAANVGHIQVYGPDGELDSLSSFHFSVSKKECYDASMGDPKLDPSLGVHIFYGGPGRGFDCP